MVTQMELDLTASEVVVITMLANLGSSLLAGDRAAAQELGAMIMRIEDSNAVAECALEKLEASLRLARTILEQEPS